MKISLSVICILTLLSLPSCAEGEDVSATVKKISRQVTDAKDKGIGTKPYEDLLSSIETDIKQGKSTDEINKRLTSLEQALHNQLGEAGLLKAGERFYTLGSKDAVAWGAFAPYMMSAQRKIKRYWFPPKGNKYTRMVVIFKVSRLGKISQVRITESSGNKEFDDAGLRALESANPLSSFPSSFKENDADIQFTFDYNSFNGGGHGTDQSP